MGADAPRKTVIIGIDGATFDIMDQLVAAGVTPFFGELAARGVRAELGTIVPALTPPAWTSWAGSASAWRPRGADRQQGG